MSHNLAKVPVAEFRRVTTRALRGEGHCAEDAEIMTKVIEYAEMRGNNQGIIKIVTGGLVANPTAGPIRTVFETPVSAQLDGSHRVGMAVVHAAVSTAISKAKASGIAIVGCSGYASATGALGVWARMLTDAGLIGIVMSQCLEMVAPYGSYQPIFGTNPLAIGIPTRPHAQILDMATSATAWYAIKQAAAAGKSIPDDVAYDRHGNPTTDPAQALAGAIRVFDRGIKGSHLALMVELLAGAFPGAAMKDKASAANWGSLVLAIQPNILGDEEGFLQRAQEMCERVKQAPVLPELQASGFEILLPGERGNQVEQKNLAEEVVPVDGEQWIKLQEMAARLPSDA